MAIFLCLQVLAMIHLACSYPYPMFNNRRYADTRYQPAYIPVPVSYQLQQEYDDGQDNLNPVPRYFYYPIRADRRFAYIDEPDNEVEAEQNDQGYPYAQESLCNGGVDNNAARAAANAEADAAFLRNLIITQMYQDAAASAAVGSGNPNRYGYPYMSMPVEEYDDRKWLYGVPTTGLDDKERAREFLKKEGDEEVKELESLRKQENKEGKRRRKPKVKEQREKKSDPAEELATALPLLNEVTSISSRKTKPAGQKEFVLPQPPRPVRQPFADLANRLHVRDQEPSVYQTIKQLLEMENKVTKTDDSPKKKRFVTPEEQLTAQLSSLKKSHA